MLEIAGGILLAVLVLGALANWMDRERPSNPQLREDSERWWREQREAAQARDRERYEQELEQRARHQRWLDRVARLERTDR